MLEIKFALRGKQFWQSKIEISMRGNENSISRIEFWFSINEKSISGNGNSICDSGSTLIAGRLGAAASTFA